MLNGNPGAKFRRLALRGIFLTLGVILSAAVAAGGSTVSVAPPNGLDDTANIQGALNACVAHGTGCTVQLRAGTYLTSQLVTYNFQGTLKGMGQGETTIEALPALLVTATDPFFNGECAPNTTDCLWPDLIIFVDGDIKLSDFTVSVPAIPATQVWYIAGTPATVINDGIRFMGKSPTNASADRVAVKGALDDSPTSCPGYNLCNAVTFAGEFPRSQTPFDYYFLSGTFSLSRSHFSNVQLGTVVDGFLENDKIVIGGSAFRGNVYDNVLVGPFLTTANNSMEEISYNTSNGTGAPLEILPWIPFAFVPREPSTYLIHDNILMTAGPGASGIWVQDDPSSTTVNAFVYDNNIQMQQGVGFSGIGALFTADTFVANNKIFGSAAAAIGIWDSTRAAVLVNDVASFTPNPASGLAQIVLGDLFGLPDTNDSLVVCKSPKDTVLNLGAGNKLIGCQSGAATPRLAPDGMATLKPKGLRTMSGLSIR